ncbi:uncharacterized protein CBL_07572 [Carabus blaptoides fortunei]
MSGPFKRRPSLRRPSMPGGLSGRRPSAGLLGHRRPSGAPPPAQGQEVPWDMVDRCLLPVSALTLFIWFTITTVGAVLFYHNLKVTAAGKAVLVTGCDSRMGSTLARHLDDLGFTVFAGFQNAAASQLAEELKEESSGRLHVLQLDVSNEPQVLAASLYAVEHLPDGAPGLWAVVNLASWVAMGELEWLPPPVARRAIEVNLLGTARLTQVMLPLVRRARGRIINVTSALARVASPVRGLHAATLAAIEALSSCLRLELRSRGVDVVVVAPGEYTTGTAWIRENDMLEQSKEMWHQLCQEQRQEYGEEYFETAIRSLEKYTKSQDADLTAVTRSLTDAVIRTFPLPRYTPVTRQEKLQAFVADHLPRSVYDILYS